MLTFEHCSVGPVVLPVTVRFAMLVRSLVEISIREVLFPFSMLQALVEFAFVAIAVDPNMFPMAMSLPLNPFALVRVSLIAYPTSETMLQSVLPLTNVVFTVRPEEAPLTMRFTCLVLTLIVGALSEHFNALPVLLIVEELPLVGSAIVVEEETTSILLVVDDLAEVG